MERSSQVGWANESQGCPRQFEGVLVEELDAAEGNGHAGARPFFNVLVSSKKIWGAERGC